MKRWLKITLALVLIAIAAFFIFAPASMTLNAAFPASSVEGAGWISSYIPLHDPVPSASLKRTSIVSRIVPLPLFQFP